MTTRMTFLALPVLALGLAACSEEPNELIVDGPKNARFQSDLAACKQVSLQREKEKGNTIGGAVIGGVAGGIEADSGDALGGAVAGAVIGGLIGSAEDSAEAEEARDSIVFNCMSGRGHNVVG